MNIKSIYKLITKHTSNCKLNFAGIAISFFLIIVLNFSYPQIVKLIMDKGITVKSMRNIASFSILLLFVVIAEQLVTAFQYIIFQNVKYGFQYSLNTQIFSDMLHLNTSYFNKINSTEIYESLRSDIDSVSTIVDSGMIGMLNYILRLVSGLIGLIVIDPTMTVVVLLFIPLKMLTVTFFSNKKRSHTKEYIKQSNCMASWFSDTLNGIKEIKLWNLYKLKGDIYSAKQKKLIDITKKYILMDFYNNTSDTIISGLINSILYIGGGWLVCQNGITVGDVLAFLSYSFYVTAPISSILDIKYILSRVTPSANRIIEFLGIEKEKYGDLTISYSAFSNISFNHIKFSYEEKNVFEDLNLKINNGDKIAIIGENGSGKTTLTKLLLRLIDPEAGSIQLNDIDISKYNIDNYRSLFSIINQDTYIFQDSLLDNIDLEHKYGIDKINGICRKFDIFNHINQSINNKCQQTDFVNGNNFSSGEKRKIILLRALIKDTPILILDEAASNLDDTSIKNMHKLIFNELNNKTIIFITHNYNELKFMDKVYKIESGLLKEWSV